MSKLLIVLPAARDYRGRAVLLSGGGARRLGPFRVLGTARRRISRRNSNPRHERRLPFGDPPAGTYGVAGSLPPTVRRRRPKRFGLLGALVLQPRTGEALAVADQRPRVVLHGGRCDRRGRLRRTRGGLRVSDADLQQLLAAINRAQADGDPVATVEILDLPQTAAGDRERPGRFARAHAARPLDDGPVEGGVAARVRRRRGGDDAGVAAAVPRRRAALVRRPVNHRLQHPAPCADPVPCDANTDPSCPQDGYYCDDYTSGGGSG